MAREGHLGYEFYLQTADPGTTTDAQPGDWWYNGTLLRFMNNLRQWVTVTLT